MKTLKLAMHFLISPLYFNFNYVQEQLKFLKTYYYLLNGFYFSKIIYLII